MFKRKGLNDVANLNPDIITKVESLMNEIFIKPKTMMRTSDYNGSNVEDDKTKLFQKHENLVLRITHLQDHHEVCLKLTIFIIDVSNLIIGLLQDCNPLFLTCNKITLTSFN